MWHKTARRQRLAGIGTVLDAGSDVTTLRPEQIKPAPDMGRAVNTDYVFGPDTPERRMLILVDTGQLMSRPEMGLIERRAA